MAQLVVAAAGAAIGGAIGGPAGARIGWMIGSAVGSMMFAEKQEGPKIEDGKFQSNIYGQPVALNYGTMRHAGHIAWWSGLIIRTEEVGGKGGGGAEVEKASMNLLLAVCEGPQDAVLRIWANGRLIATHNGFGYDVDREVLPAGEVRVYLGTASQMPDPTYEAAVGTEDAVAYRGTVMVAIDGLEGEFFANRPPNLEFEVASNSVPGGCSDGDNPLGSAIVYGQQNEAAYDPSRKRVYCCDSSDDLGKWGFSVWDVSGDTPVLVQWVETGNMLGGEFSYANKYPSAITYIPVIDEIVVWRNDWGSSTGAPIFRVYDAETLALKRTSSYTGTQPTYMSRTTYNSLTGTVSWWGGVTIKRDRQLLRLSDGVRLSVGPNGGPAGYVEIPGTSDAYLCFYDPNATTDEIYRYNLATDAVGAKVTGGVGSGEAERQMVWDSVRRKVYIGRSSGTISVINYDANPGAVESIVDLSGQIPQWGSGNDDFVYMDGYDILAFLTCGSGLDSGSVTYVDPEDWSVVRTCPLAGSNRIGARLVTDRSWHVEGNKFVSWLDGSIYIWNGAGVAATGSPVTLRSIVEDVSGRVGYPLAALDATAGTDLVSGFKVARQTSARAVIDSLRPAYFFDLPEIGSQLVLTKRGAASVATIDSGELGARIWGASDDPEPAYELQHTEEQEVPRRLELTYVDAAASYDPGVQVAERQVGESESPLQMEVPVSLTETQAARIAWVNLMLAHASKDTIRLKLSHAYEGLVPSDAIMVPHESGETLRVRIDQITRARPMIEIEGVLEEQSVYSFDVGGVPRYQGPRQTTIGTIGDTLLALLDLPPLRDQDDTLILYSAMARDAYDAAWPGASLYRSIDAGASYSAVYATPTGATMGVTSNALGDWTVGNVWDTTNTLDVILTSGSLSTESDLGVYNGANVAAVVSASGVEIIQFANAELIDTNTWRISRLLRGRKGTEYLTGSHSAGERFVLLTTAALRVLDMQIGEIGALRQYKAVTSRQAIADAAVTTNTLAGNSIKPLAPILITGTRDGGNNLTATWVRRARINHEWMDSQDVPLDEPTESYEIDIYSGATVVRTITASTPTVSYSAAEQTADGLTPGDPVVLAVYQMSSRIGRGHAGEATV